MTRAKGLWFTHPQRPYVVDKYKGAWAVFDLRTCVWYFPDPDKPGTGKTKAQALAIRLNAQDLIDKLNERTAK